ncbi:MAG: thioesterase family protein [Xanthobacteraceae bacterium]|nr:thioesterase family protein [Xanthobacteraceae bacterium]
MHPLDAAVRLEKSGDKLSGATSDAYWNFTGPFGGATAATLLQAGMQHPSRQNLPLAMTINYCAPVAKGAFDIHVAEKRTNRSTQHFYVEMVQGADTIATATLVFAARPEGFAHTSGKIPAVKSPEEIDPPKAKAPLAWIDRFDMRFASGFPVMRPKDEAPLGSARTEVWMRDNPVRTLDFLGLVNMSDAFFARPFHVLGRLIQVGTVSMTTYFHCDEQDLAETGEDYLLGVADANVFNKGYADQTASLWSRGGKLLATSQQILYFRDKAFVPGGKK